MIAHVSMTKQRRAATLALSDALDEVERLGEEALLLSQELTRRDEALADLEATVERLQAENAELRQALRKIQDEGDAHSNAVATATIEGPTT